MINKTLFKTIMFFASFLLIAKVGIGQEKNPPKVAEISSKYQFVLVTKPLVEQGKPARAVKADFTATDEPFDIAKLDQYARFSFEPINVMNPDGTSDRCFSIHSLDIDKYYYRNSEMISSEDYNRLWEKGEDFKFKSDFSARQSSYFQPREKTPGYIRFYIPNDENKSLYVTPSTWVTREVKLYLVKKPQY